MLKRLVAYLLGTLRIEVRGGRIAHFLNLALEEGISLWQIERTSDKMIGTLTIRDFRRLRRVVPRAGVRVHILRKRGLPFLALRLRRRPVLLTGAAACLGFVLWATSHIWTVHVKVTGPQYLDPRAVAAVAAEAGLKRGAWKSQVRLNEVQQHIQRRMPETSWVVLRLQGTRAVIEVVEKAQEKPVRSTPCTNLTARKAGVIEQVITFQGEPMVRVGETVGPGTLLVECSFRYYPGGRPQVFPGTPLPPREGISRTLMARGIVRARIAYHEYLEVPLWREVTVPTGRISTQWGLRIRGRPILQGGATVSGFAQAQEARRAYPPAWRNWKSPVELVIVRAEEVETRREPVTLERAVSKARADMEARLRWLLGPTDRILTPLQIEVVEKGQEFAALRLTVETLEEISDARPGAPSPTSPEPNKGDR